ncbi:MULTISPECIES: hypothetical protein [Pyrococcus]|nr:hypothetical protein [Pyrococcus sp.]
MLNAIFLPYVIEFNMKSDYARKKYIEIAKEIGFNTAEMAKKAYADPPVSFNPVEPSVEDL